jgi:hypothetical protein
VPSSTAPQVVSAVVASGGVVSTVHSTGFGARVLAPENLIFSIFFALSQWPRLPRRTKSAPFGGAPRLS